MNVEQLLQNFQITDLEWLIPVVAGLVIIVGGLLIALVRGVSAGVIIAIFFGGLLSLSPVLLNALERQSTTPGSSHAVEVARDTAALAKLNNTTIVDLSRVVTTMRTALEGVIPSLEAAADIDPAAKARLTQAMSSSAERLDAISNNVAQSQVMLRDLDAALDALENEMRRAPQSPR